MDYSNQKGLSLIGVIISILIVSIGLVGVLSLADASIKGASVGKTRLIASGLTQEGIEIVRDIRRSHYSWSDWEWYGTIATSTSQDFRVQYNDTDLIGFSETLLKRDGSGFYQYDSGDDTSFYRKITLTKVSFREVKLVVEVKWQLKGKWYNLTAEDHLWNWK